MKKIITISLCALGLIIPMVLQPTASAYEGERDNHEMAFRHHDHDRVWVRGHFVWRHHHKHWVPGHYAWL